MMSLQIEEGKRMSRKNKNKRVILWTGVLFWIISWILMSTNWSEAQYIGTYRWATRQEMVDSLESYQSLTGFTGTVAEGVVACADSTGALDTASYDDPYLNRKLIGFGTGDAGVIRISGIADSTDAAKIGIVYYLGVSGTLTDTMPTATNVWVVEVGVCTDTGKIRLLPIKPKARMQ